MVRESLPYDGRVALAGRAAKQCVRTGHREPKVEGRSASRIRLRADRTANALPDLRTDSLGREELAADRSVPPRRRSEREHVPRHRERAPREARRAAWLHRRIAARFYAARRIRQ